MDGNTCGQRMPIVRFAPFCWGFRHRCLFYLGFCRNAATFFLLKGCARYAYLVGKRGRAQSVSDKNGAEYAETCTTAATVTDQEKSASVLLVTNDSVRPLVEAALVQSEHLLVGYAAEPGQAIGLTRSVRPDVVLIHASLFPVPSFDVTRTLTTQRVAPVVWFGEAENIPPLVVPAGQAGAMGLLSLPLRTSDVGPMLWLARTRFLEIAGLEAEVKSLNERMEARKLVGRAKALLMERFRLSERDAFRRIQAQSTALNKPVHEIARAIITASEIAA